MSGIRDIPIKQEYRSLITDIAEQFYIPLLSHAVSYKRAVGFFSSSSLVEISYGIGNMVKNGGRIQIIASPKLSQEDINAIERGYELRDKIIGDALLRELYEVDDFYDQERLNLLAHLIADGYLDIRIAVVDKEESIGMYHEKMGIITDVNGDKVAFSGSMNESLTALRLNYESIDVYKSWGNESVRVMNKEEAFDRLWESKEQNVQTFQFKDIDEAIVSKFKRDYVDYSIDTPKTIASKVKEDEAKDWWIKKPSHIHFYDYQEEAINAWEEHSYKGIFDMATGTGKTLTALGALERLAQNQPENLVIIIVAPYQHLVEQWVEDLVEFGLDPIICYSKYNKWRKKVRDKLFDKQIGLVKNLCLITTNATYMNDSFQNIIYQIEGDICLVVDEAHNFGAKKLSSKLNPIFKYRLALSATLERHRDDEGTKRLLDYFGEKCIEYDLARAIKEKKLTPYYYYPIEVNLEDDELDDYMELSHKIAQILGTKSEDDDIGKSAEMLLIKRARLVAGARQKLSALKEIIAKEYLVRNNILIYCGATNVNYSIYKEGSVDSDEERQIDHVLKILGNELGMKVTKFTSEETPSERELIKKNFSEGKMLQAIVAIRCLDEGVNIPGISVAFILASSTNPKEYIQRRGRVLRKAPNKDFAYIYDFITLPRKISEVKSYNPDRNFELSLINREFSRLDEFSRLAENPSESLRLKEKIGNAYKIYEK